MGGSSGNDTTKQTTKSSPWGPQEPYLKYGMDEATRLYQSAGPQYYPGSTVAGFSPTQQQAQQLGTSRALNGSQAMKNAQGFSNSVLSGGFSGDAGARGYVNDVMGGKYLNSDPYSDNVYQNIQSKVMPSVNSQFMGSGRYGSNLQTDTATRALTESYAPYASQQYQSGLDRMGQAAGMAQNMYNTDVANRFGAANMAPMFAANDWTDINALSNIGGQQQQLGQQELNDAAARWDYYQRLPFDKLGTYLNNIGGNYGGTAIGTTKTPQPSMFQQATGAGLGLLGLLA
jgi:precorrin-3B methylase